MRYWKPAPELAEVVSGYHLYAVDTPAEEPHSDVFQPAWASLRFLLDERTSWRVRPRDGAWREVPRVALFGPSSMAYASESDSGIVVGIGLKPAGWLRHVDADAADWADRVGAAAGVINRTLAPLRDRLMALESDEDVPRAFDEWLLAGAGSTRPREHACVAVEAALLDPEIAGVGALAEHAGLSVRGLERLAKRAFGFPPKLLLRRARFLRSLHAIREVPAARRAGAIDEGYVDYSHFVRDARQFLGMSPGQFLRLDTPMLNASLALRKQVLGAPAQALGTKD